MTEVDNDSSSRRSASDDVLRLLSRITSKLNTEWVRASYPFAAVGRRISISYSCDLGRRDAPCISLGNNVLLASNVWLNIVGNSGAPRSKLVLGDGCRIGRRST